MTTEQMQYLVAFAQHGTLSGVAERFCISQPTVTRSMKQVEQEFGVPLFERTKNSIALNDNGRLAAAEAQELLHRHEEMLRRVRMQERANHTICIGSAAAVQIPELIRHISELYPTATLTSELKRPDELLRGLLRDEYQLIILPYQPQDDSLLCTKIGEEHLMFFLPPQHRFAGRTALSMAEMNGENMLLFSQIGFWHDITVQKMPDSRFLVQTERYSLDELVINSVLPSFVTNLSLNEQLKSSGRVCVPITDPEVNVSYSLVCKKQNRRQFAQLFA